MYGAVRPVTDIFVLYNTSVTTIKMNNKILVCIFTCSTIFAGCAVNNQAFNGTTINISGDKNTELLIDSFVTSIDSILLQPNAIEHMGEVQDMCLSDSNAYILDKANSIWKFNLNTGLQEKKIKKTGHGHGEYINPTSICVDHDNVYVLDFQGSSIIVYDKDLDYKNRIQLEFPSIDFAKVPDGFLLCNMNPTNDLKRIVLIDEKGNVINSFLSTEMKEESMMTDRFFSKDDNGSVFFAEPASNIIYKWENGNVLPIYSIEFGKITNDKNASKANPLHGNMHIRSFVTSQYVITLYLSEFVLTNVYNEQKATSISGLVNTRLRHPFYPIAYYDGALYGIYDIQNDNKNMILIKYNIRPE